MFVRQLNIKTAMKYNKTLLKILSAREDISDYLFHFTKGSDAKNTLTSILGDSEIKDVKRGYICF